MTEHWADILLRDHETTEKVFDVMSQALATESGPDPVMVADLMTWLVEYVDDCHNRKEEEHLFPLAEQRGVPRDGGPLAVMLMEHEESRRLLAALRPLADQYAGGDRGILAGLREAFGAYAELIKGHYWKENDILYPMARRVFSPDDDAAVVAGIRSLESALGPEGVAPYFALAEGILLTGGLEDLSLGLEAHTLAAILNTIPVELSFVDAEDTVRYFNHENRKKIFPRTRGAIGMKVQQCHPEKSVHLVTQILADFRAGTRDVAEFWIDFMDMKVHIRYWPVRSPKGEYLGCLETVQDVTAIQGLADERRLLSEEEEGKS